MNERIRELMLEAGYAAPELAGRANKFAELIVRECGKVAMSGVVDGYVMRDLEVALKQHFGVEN